MSKFTKSKFGSPFHLSPIKEERKTKINNPLAISPSKDDKNHFQENFQSLNSTISYHNEFLNKSNDLISKLADLPHDKRKQHISRMNTL